MSFSAFAASGFLSSPFTVERFGFSLGPDHHLHRGAPDQSAHARWLVLVGLGISGYFGFSLASTFVYTDSKEEGNGTRNI